MLGCCWFFYGFYGEELIDRFFDIAYFWRMNPREALGLTLDELSQYENQAERIFENMKD